MFEIDTTAQGRATVQMDVKFFKAKDNLPG